MLPQGGEVAVHGSQSVHDAARYRIASSRGETVSGRPDVEGWTHFVRHAEAAGIDSVLISFSRFEPDPILVASALGQATATLKFIAAYRSGLIQPANFVQQINTLSCLIQGRVAVNVVAGSASIEQHGYGDFLEHEARYARAEEFIAACRAFWRSSGAVDFTGTHYRVAGGRLTTPFVAGDRAGERREPEVYVSGHSASAERVALSQGSCLLRVADAPRRLAPAVERSLARGVEVCLRMCVICRPTREEAVRVAESLLPGDPEAARRDRGVGINDDSVMYKEAAARSTGADPWLDRSLWAGLVPYYGPVWTTLLGTPDEIADALLAYKAIGVTQFILSGWPELDEVIRFGREVAPLVRQAEQRGETVRAEA
jgi:alkanesulfonate monooxygenase